MIIAVGIACFFAGVIVGWTTLGFLVGIGLSAKEQEQEKSKKPEKP